MKVVWTTLLMLFCIAGLLLLAAYLTDDRVASPAASPATNNSDSQPSGRQSDSPRPASAGSQEQQQPSQMQGRTQLNSDVINVRKFKNLANKYKVEILQIQNIAGGIDVKLSARDHIATGDLLTTLLDAGIMRDFDQSKNDVVHDNQGNRKYLSEIKIYWR